MDVNVIWQKDVGVSEDCTGSVFRVKAWKQAGSIRNGGVNWCQWTPYLTTWRQIREDSSSINSQRCGNLRSDKINIFGPSSGPYGSCLTSLVNAVIVGGQSSLPFKTLVCVNTVCSSLWNLFGYSLVDESAVKDYLLNFNLVLESSEIWCHVFW
jgi:hypothetical protein